MRRVFRRLIRRVNTTEWSVSWFEVLPGDDPTTLAERLDGLQPPQTQQDSINNHREALDDEPNPQA